MQKLILIATILLVWRAGIITTYHNKFEGRRCADGSVFHQKNMIVAMVGVKLGTKVEIKYGGHKVIARVTDTGKLRRLWHIDASRGVAKRLGLYRITKAGKTDRNIKWRRIR